MFRGRFTEVLLYLENILLKIYFLAWDVARILRDVCCGKTNKRS